VSPSENATTFRLISLVIIAVLGLQLFAVIARPGKWTWPFTDYPMYSHSRHDGDRVVARHFVVGTTVDGEEVAITPKDLGVVLWVYERWAGALMAAAQKTDAAASANDQAAQSSQLPRFTRHGWPLRRWLKSTALFQLFKSKPDPDLAAMLTEHFQTASGHRLVRLRVEDTPVIVTRAGQAAAPPRSVEVELPLSGSD
jgi:hypothetical protein